jgi:two-component system nitrate/nitrite response regulator NarL
VLPAGIRILVADHHPIFRKGLRSVLEEEPGFVVVGEASDGEEAVRYSRTLRPDILLLDLAMRGRSAMDALTELSAGPQQPVRTIVMTASIEKPEIVKVLQLGAVGVVLKTASPDVVSKSIRSVMDGQHWIGREVVSDVVRALQHYSDKAEKTERKRFGLTARELEITAAVTTGLSNKEIARKFSLSGDTVKHHLTRIFDKVGASNRLELALFAVHHRLLEVRSPDEPHPNGA